MAAYVSWKWAKDWNRQIHTMNERKKEIGRSKTYCSATTLTTTTTLIFVVVIANSQKRNSIKTCGYHHACFQTETLQPKIETNQQQTPPIPPLPQYWKINSKRHLSSKKKQTIYPLICIRNTLTQANHITIDWLSSVVSLIAREHMYTLYIYGLHFHQATYINSFFFTKKNANVHKHTPHTLKVY